MANFIIDYNNSSEYQFDSDKIEVDSGLAKLKDLVSAEETFYANYNTNINGNRGNGVLTGTAYGGASVSGGKLDLAHSDERYVDYSAVGNADSQQVGCVRFKVAMNYSGAPGRDRWLFCIAKSNNDIKNVIQLRHSKSGAYLRLHMYDKDGVQIVEHLCGQFLPVAGTEYEIEVNWDLTTGATRLFVNGIQNGSTYSGTALRDSNIGLLRIGSDYDAGGIDSNFTIDDFQVFSDVQHTTNYTPESPSEIKYADDSPTIYKTLGDGIANIAEWPTFTETLGAGNEGSVKYQISEDGSNWYYWNGSSWISAGVSDYNTYSEINVNIDEFSTSANKIYVKAFLISDGSQKIELDLNEVGYIINTAPILYAGTDKTAIYNTSMIPFSDCTFSDAEGNIVKAEWKVEGGIYVEIPQGAYGTLLEAVQAFSNAFTHSGNKNVYLKITDFYDEVSEDYLVVNVDRVTVTVNIEDSDSYDLSNVTFTPGDGQSSTVQNSPFSFTYKIGSWSSTCAKTGYLDKSQSVTITIATTSIDITMIEKTPISSMNISLDWPLQIAIGDSINIPCQVNGDLTGYGIRCEIYDKAGTELKLANTTAGGSDSEISDTLLTNGKFLIQLAEGQTDDFGRVLEQEYSQIIKAWIEIELEDTDSDKYTIYKKSFNLIQQGLDWDTI